MSDSRDTHGSVTSFDGVAPSSEWVAKLALARRQQLSRGGKTVPRLEIDDFSADFGPVSTVIAVSSG